MPWVATRRRVGGRERDHRLGEVTLHPSGPDAILTELLDSVESDLRRIRHALDAEVWASALLGVLDQVVEAFAEGDPAEAREAFVVQLVDLCERRAAPSTLAVVRALSAVLSGSLRTLADQTAASMARSGMKERAWASRLGASTVGRCWHYGDVGGRQESVSVAFLEGRHGQVLTVLVDRDLGGGVKDVWAAEDPDDVWEHTQQVVGGDPLTLLEPISWQRARAVLRAAVAAPECPEQPDQIEDVALHRAVLHARLAKLNGQVWSPSGVAAASVPPGLVEATSRPPMHRAVATDRVMRLKASVKGAKPPIWRRLEVPASITLPRLHCVLQAAFDWEDRHVHAFEVGPETYMPPGEARAEMEAGSEMRVRLDQLVGPGDRLLYRYDFGDDWEVVLQVEAVERPEEGMRYPRCTAGRRPAPPEDSGGILRFEAAGDSGRAGRFDIAEVDRRLARVVRQASLVVRRSGS
jgi:Plasmid pRiA4b ORF-3-like protein